MDRILYNKNTNTNTNNSSNDLSSSPSQQFKVATFKKTIKKKNILFDFEEEVLEDEETPACS